MLSLLYVILLIEGDSFINAFPTRRISSRVPSIRIFLSDRRIRLARASISHACRMWWDHGGMPDSIQLFVEIAHSQFGYRHPGL